MLLKCYSIRDSKAEIYEICPPFLTRAVALRWFEQMVNNPQNPWSRNPEDYDLFEIGEFNQDTGMMIPGVSPTHVAKAIDYKKDSDSDVPLRQVQ